MSRIQLLNGNRKRNFGLFTAIILLSSIFSVVISSSVLFAQPGTPGPLQPNIFDEYFTYATVTPFDTDNDDQNDAARVEYDVDTEGASEEVKVLMHVYNSSAVIIKNYSETFRVVHEIEINSRYFEFYAQYTDNYNFSLELYDLTHDEKENNGLNEEALPSPVLLQVNTSEYQIFVDTFPLDEDDNGYYDDVIIKVTDSLNFTLEGVEIYIGGYFYGYSDADGLYYYYNLSRGIHEVDALYGGYHDNAEFRSEGVGINQPLYADADPYDQDADGYDDDVIIYSMGPNYVALPGAQVYIDWRLAGITNRDGMFYGYDFEIGFHYVMITFQDYTAYSAFYAEGSNVTDLDEYFFFIWGEASDLDGGGELNDVDVYIDVDVSEGGTSHVYVYATVYYQNRTIAAKGDVNYSTTGWEIEDQHIYIYNLSYDVYYIRYELYDDNGNLEDVAEQTDLVIMSSFGIINVDRMIYNFEGPLMNDIIYFAHIKDLAVENVKIEIFYMSDDSYVTNVTTDEYGIAFYEDLPFDTYYWYANDSDDNMIEYGEFNIYTAPQTAQVQDYLADEDGDNFHDEFIITAYDPSGSAVHTVNYLIWDEDDVLFDSGNTLGGQAVVEDIPEGNYTFYIKFGTTPFIWLCNGSFYSYGTPSESINALNLYITPQDYDSDGYYDDVEVLATNSNDLPVIGIVVTFDSDPLNSDTTNIQGKAQGYDFEFGWHSVDAVNPYEHQGVPTGARAHAWFFSEGPDYIEYFNYIRSDVEDLNNDNEWNDINFSIDVNVFEDVESIVTVYVYVYYQSNGTPVATANKTFEVYNSEWDLEDIYIYDLPYNETYNATFILYDSDNNKEDEAHVYDIQVIQINPIINIDFSTSSNNIDNIQNDIHFEAYIAYQEVGNINIKIYNKTTNNLMYDIYSDENNNLRAENLNDGDYYYIAYNQTNAFIEYGEFFIGTNIEIWEYSQDIDWDGYWDDFGYYAYLETQTGYQPTNSDIFIYDSNNKLIDSMYSMNGSYDLTNLTEGHYNFKVLNNSIRLSNGTFYIYGNGFENQPPSPLISSPLDQSEHDPTSSIHFDGTSSTDPDYWDQLTYYWESDLDGKLGETGEFWKQLSEGDHLITLWTDDAHGHNPSTSAAIAVQQPMQPNDPPNAILTSPTEAQQFYTTDSISFDGSTSSDPDGDPLTFYWTSNITGAIAGNVSQFSKSLEKGYHNITMFVEDNQSHNVSAFVRISVIEPSVEPNDDPIANISSPGNNSMWNATDLIFFESYGTYDPDDDVNDDGIIDPVNETDNLTYQWTSNITGDLSTSPNFNTSELGSPLDTGHHLINLTVIDLLGGGGNATASIEIVIANLPPTATITAPDEGELFFKSNEIDFLGQSTDPENDILYYYWEVVDKDTPSNVYKIHNQSHFTRKLPAGEYAVTFYADDHNGPDEFAREHNVSALVNISVENRAPVAFAGADRNVNIGEKVEFNASGSSDPDDQDGANDEANFTYLWNFGDGFSLPGMVVYHTFSDSIVYNVSLTVTDTESTTNNTGMAYVKITVNTPPTAEVWAPSVVTKDIFGDAKVYFDASNSSDDDGDNLTFVWDFDDGITGVGMTTTHTYTLAKVYNVSVNVSDTVGYGLATISVRVNTAPVAEAGDDSTEVKVNQLIEFDGTASSDPDNDIITYSWDFGDGTTDETENPTHKYTVSANYIVTLNVTDEWGALATDIIDVTVLPPTPEFTSHSEDDTVLGKVIIEGRTPASAGEVSLVEIKIGSNTWQDADPRATDDWSTWSYEWDTIEDSNGDYRILARLENAIGLSSEVSINLTVFNPITYPTISITSPNDGTEVKDKITIRGSTTGESITSVKIRIGSTSTFKTVTKAGPGNDYSLWTYTWDTTRSDNGDITILANVTARIGNKDYYDETSIEVTVNNPEEPEPTEDDDEGGEGLMDTLIGNTMLLYGIIGFIILLILIILIAVMRKGKKKRERKPEEEEEAGERFAPGLPPPPELELMEPGKEEEVPKKPPEVKKLPVKCPKCKDIFITEDDGSRPIILKCETCGARGIIRTPPEPEEEEPKGEEEGEGSEGDSDEDTSEKKEDEEEEVKRKPIIKCPNCSELFPVDEESGEIECPNCGIKGTV